MVVEAIEVWPEKGLDECFVLSTAQCHGRQSLTKRILESQQNGKLLDSPSTGLILASNEGPRRDARFTGLG